MESCCNHVACNSILDTQVFSVLPDAFIPFVATSSGEDSTHETLIRRTEVAHALWFEPTLKCRALSGAEFAEEVNPDPLNRGRLALL